MGKGKSIKRPVPSEGGNIRFHAADPVSPDRKHFAFGFRYLSDAQKYDIRKLPSEHQRAFLRKCAVLSKLTWGEAKQSGRHQSGHEKIPHRAIRQGMPDVITPDVTLIAFRYHDKQAMVGFRDRENVFQVLWFDSDFSLYDHG